MPTSMLKLGAVLTVVFGLYVLMEWHSSAEAVIVVRSAAVQNGVAVVEGGNAARSAPISWEGALVTQANNGGNFAFQGVVPADCVGSLNEGDPAAAIVVALAHCEPVSGAPAPVPQTGQTTLYAPGNDGNIQAGVPFPRPRFTDNGNGTVRDNLTGLIWLKDASCIVRTWADALAAMADFNAGVRFGCVEYVAGTLTDWRLPNVKELQSLVDFGFAGIALSNAAGTAPWREGDAFVDVRTHYWSSTTTAGGPESAWIVDLGENGRTIALGKGTALDVWPVRGPE